MNAPPETKPDAPAIAEAQAQAEPAPKVFHQDRRGQSPWSRGHRIKTALWVFACALFFRTCPKPFNGVRLVILRLFGAHIEGSPYIDASCFIKYPWHLTVQARATIGPKADIYNLGHITLEEGCTVAQQSYLCTGTHDLDDPILPLVTAPIVIGRDVFVGVRALVMPGITVGRGAVLAGGAVVTKNVEPWTIVGGNPAKPIKQRTPFEDPAASAP